MTRRRNSPLAPWALLWLTAMAMPASAIPAAVPASAVPAPTAVLRALPGGVLATPPLPPPSTYSVRLVADDDGADAAFGVAAGPAAKSFAWFQRFESPGAFTLEAIWVLFAADPSVAAGAAVDLVVYHDADGDPSNGATLLAVVPETVQVADGDTFSLYELPEPIDLPSGGAVLLGVVTRFYTGAEPPSTTPAALDSDSGTGDAWVAVWSGDPPAIPTLPADVLTVPLEDLGTSGQWMIRGFGQVSPVLDVPTVSSLGLLLMAISILGLGWIVLRSSPGSTR